MIDESVRVRFPGAPGYLDTASLGLPPQLAVDAMTTAIADWQAGTATATAPGHDRFVENARDTFAAMVGVARSRVAVGAQVQSARGQPVARGG